MQDLCLNTGWLGGGGLVSMCVCFNFVCGESRVGFYFGFVGTWGICRILCLQDLLEILDLELFGVKTLVSILIEVSLATFILLDSCLVRRIFLKILLDSCLVRNRYLQSRLILA